METDPVDRPKAFPVDLSKLTTTWVAWLFLLLYLFVVSGVMSRSISDYPIINSLFLGFAALLTGWNMSLKKNLLLRIFLAITFGLVLIVLVQSGALVSFSRAMVNYMAIQGPFNRDLFAFNITFTLEQVWNYVNTLQDALEGANLDEVARGIQFAFIVQLIAWFSLLIAAILLRRGRHGFLVSLPILSSIILLSFFTRIKTAPILLALSVVLVSSIVLEILNKEKKWKASGIDFSPEVRMDTLILSFPLIVVVLLLSGFIPEISIREIIDRINEKKVEYQVITPPARPDYDSYQPVIPQEEVSPKGIMPREHLLGNDPQLSQEIVMTVQTSLRDTPTSLEMLNNYYLSGTIYDHYTGKGWMTSEISMREVEPNDLALPMPPSNARLILQSVNMHEGTSGTFYLAGTPLTANQPIAYFFRSQDDLFTSSVNASSYSAYSYILPASEEDLKGDQGAIPGWVEDRYLQLPADLPGRLTSLAHQLTDEYPTNFEKIIALQTFLRAFPYSLTIPPPPKTGDVVDYFLFELKTGYCDYYASAMVVLARIVNIPARLVVGFTLGSYDAETGNYLVREQNAHAWPEIYFPNYGWIAFEPTASLSVFSFSEGEGFEPARVEEIPRLPAENRTFILSLVGLGAGLVVIIVIVLLCAFSKRPRQKAGKKIPLLDKVNAQYKRITEAASILGVTYHPAMTPLELKVALERLVESTMVANSRQKVTALQGIARTERLFGLFIDALYSKDRPADHEIAEIRLLVGQQTRFFTWLKIRDIFKHLV